MTTPIHFIGGEKGGVGKSLTARVLAQYMIDKEHRRSLALTLTARTAR